MASPAPKLKDSRAARPLQQPLKKTIAAPQYQSRRTTEPPAGHRGRALITSVVVSAPKPI